MARGNGIDGVEIGALAIQADRDDGPGAWRNSGFKCRRVQVTGARIHVYIDRLCSQQRDGFSGGNIGKARHDDFIAGADP
ncbi:hypothetical protein FQZ97_1203140 [compost metagenome]